MLSSHMGRRDFRLHWAFARIREDDRFKHSVLCTVHGKCMILVAVRTASLIIPEPWTSLPRAPKQQAVVR